MANTTNLDLVKPLGTDHALISVINSNMDKIDNFAGNVEDSFGAVQDGMAIVANGDTHVAITSGQFVYVRNHDTLSEGLYIATANIAANGELSASNLTADSSGGLNALNIKIDTINIGSKTLSALQTYLETLGDSMADNTYKFIRFYNEAASSPFVASTAYFGQIFKFTTGRYEVTLQGAGSPLNTITGIYNSGWTWDSLNSKITNNQLVTYVTKTYTDQPVTSSGSGGYYCSGDDIAVPSGYTPISACWNNDFITCVFPVIYYFGKWMIALNAPKSIASVSGTVRIMCVKNTVG